MPLSARLPLSLSAEDYADLAGHPERLRGGQGWVLVAAARDGSPWVYVQAVPVSALRAAVLPTLLPNALLGLALLAGFVASQWFFARWFVAPALAVLGYLRLLSTDPAARVPQLGPRWQGWVDAVTDTFEVQRLLQRRERAHEAFKSAMVDHAPTAIITTGGQGHIVDFSPAAEGMFGLQRAQVLGRDLAEVIMPARLQADFRPWADDPQRRGGWETTGRHASGREFPMQLQTFQVQIDGEPFDTAFITDLSAQHEAARQIDRQREALRQSEKLSAMGTLLAGVAHELNNPLAIVMGRVSPLYEKAEGRQLQSDARRILEAAERCGRIVRTFLNMARQKPPSRSPVQLGDIVRAAADMLGYTLRSHGIRLDLQLAEGRPAVQADADQLGQVVLNLVVNAQQALESAQGVRRLQVSTGVEALAPGREPRVWLRVTDNGPGVPAAVRERLFEPFFTTKAAGFGTGLGLSVSRSIVLEHGGELVLESAGPEFGGGACFRLSLPISGAAGPHGEATSPGAASPESHSRVLVVDDEAEVADLMRAVLESDGFDVATAESGAVALELLAEARFDAIVSDVRMPDLDGAALWRSVRERHPPPGAARAVRDGRHAVRAGAAGAGGIGLPEPGQALRQGRPAGGRARHAGAVARTRAVPAPPGQQRRPPPGKARRRPGPRARPAMKARDEGMRSRHAIKACDPGWRPLHCAASEATQGTQAWPCPLAGESPSRRSWRPPSAARWSSRCAGSKPTRPVSGARWRPPARCRCRA